MLAAKESEAVPAQPPQFKNNYFTEMCSGSEAGSYLRRVDSCITQLKAQGPSRTCNESKEETRKQVEAQEEAEKRVGSKYRALRDQICTTGGPKVNCVTFDDIVVVHCAGR